MTIRVANNNNNDNDNDDDEEEEEVMYKDERGVLMIARKQI